MEENERAVIVTALAEELGRAGSWCGETHVQKASYFLQEIYGVPTGFHFVLYKHGPFSFDLRDELVNLRVYGLIDLIPRPLPYGPSLVPTQAASKLRGSMEGIVHQYQGSIQKVVEIIDRKGVAELESLATALYIRQTEGLSESKEIATKLKELKPHVSSANAKSAAAEMNQILGAKA
jgi:uncharacterized protein YwgA